MISGISKKVIFLFLLFINFLQSSLSAELSKIQKNNNNQNIELTSSTISNLETPYNFQKIILSDNLYGENDYLKSLEKKKRFNIGF